MNWQSGSMVVWMTFLGWTFPEVESGWGWGWLPWKKYQAWRDKNAVGKQAITEFLAPAFKTEFGRQDPLKITSVNRIGATYDVHTKAVVTFETQIIEYHCAVGVIMKEHGKHWTLEKTSTPVGRNICSKAVVTPRPEPRRGRGRGRGGRRRRRPSRSPSRRGSPSPPPSRRRSVSNPGPGSPASSSYSNRRADSPSSNFRF